MLEKPSPEYSPRRPSEQETEASSRAVTPNRDPSPAPPQYRPSGHEEHVEAQTTSQPPTKMVADASVRSIASLSSFPAPPTHFPMPPMAKAESNSPTKESRPDSPRGPRTPSEILFQRRTESPVPLPPSETPRPLSSSPAEQHVEPSIVAGNNIVSNDKSAEGSSNSQLSANSEDRDVHERRETRTPSPVLTRATSKKIKFESAGASPKPANSFGGSSQGGESVDGSEFGALQRKDDKPSRQSGSTEGPTPQPIERSDTGVSNGSVVAALRDRYSRIVSRSSFLPSLCVC